MGFYCKLKYPAYGFRQVDVPRSVENCDNYELVVMEACELLAGTGCKFHIEGFGCPDWQLDIAYDLSAFMEQLPEVLEGIETGCHVELDLYSQGVERTLGFEPAEDSVEIGCASRTGWTPNPPVESIERSELVEMLSRLTFDFAHSLAMINSPISTKQPFVNWLVGSKGWKY